MLSARPSCHIPSQLYPPGKKAGGIEKSPHRITRHRFELTDFCFFGPRRSCLDSALRGPIEYCVYVSPLGDLFLAPSTFYPPAPYGYFSFDLDWPRPNESLPGPSW